MIDLILLRTLGDDENGRPESAMITESEFARYAAATVDGVHRALSRLEHTLGVLASQAVGRRKEYRLVLDSPGPIPATPRKLRRKPPRSEGLPAPSAIADEPVSEPDPPGATACASVESEAAPSNPVLEYVNPPAISVVIEPETDGVPVTLPAAARTVVFRNRTAQALEVTATAAQGALEIAFADAVRQASTSLDLAQCREFLLEFLPILHCGPREKDIEELAAARAGRVPIAQLRAYVQRRLAAGLVLTGYGIFARLARDCIASAEAWSAAHSRQAPAEAQRDTAARLAEYSDRLNRAGPEFALIAADVRSLDFGDDFERLNAALFDTQARIAETGRVKLAARIPEFRRAIAGELKAYRERMTRAQWEQLERQQLERRILELLDLPGLLDFAT